MMARAKINLDLLITGRRDDGYHLLNSLVVFANYGDEIIVDHAQNMSQDISLDILGPFAHGLENLPDNIILRAASVVQEKFNIKQGAKITLVKNLPIASGIGGGSADAAAAILGLVKLWNITCVESELSDLGLLIGADVPVCIKSRTTEMSGIGEKLRPLSMKYPLYLLLVNGGISVSTAEIFKTRAANNMAFSAERTLPDKICDLDHLLDILKSTGNDLQSVACDMNPEIGETLKQINHQEGCLFHAMSGSGATCFGIFSSSEHTINSAQELSKAFPHWWVKPVQTV
ncbi:MAG: 4-(cytidine 5'-diphospho)-2-C-methyl-D-erythritol kinase [Emcibacter sp.]|nr:4-(cytidine 5'-diphospho)-2-C-methyl-D-erythritol kinase [Emcibacter sp.]